MFETHRGALRFIRKLLHPILKLFFNPNALIHALHTQSEINKVNLEREVTRENQRRDMDALYFEVIHNLVFELTRTGIEVKNLKMRVESLASRVEFSERRARALESVVVYKRSDDDRDEPAAPQPAPRPRSGAGSQPPPAAAPAPRPIPLPPPAGPTAEAAGASTTPAATGSPETGGAPETPGATKPKAAAAAWAPRRRPRRGPDGPVDRPGAGARRRATHPAADGRAILVCGPGTARERWVLRPGAAARITGGRASGTRRIHARTFDGRWSVRRLSADPATDSAASDPEHGSDPDQP